MEKNKFRFENLEIYKETLFLIELIYTLTKKFPKDEMFGITNQLRRASVSILLNIAEGSSRTRKDFAHFLSLSKGSCFECVAILEVCKNQKYISDKEFLGFYERLNKISRMIGRFQISLRTATSDSRQAI
ncbi:MAG: four helix bundle protein [Candidatus Levybacteria bacterium]|nr:four helix bundle protein [Candidatus Levybacteria bacterium]